MFSQSVEDLPVSKDYTDITRRTIHIYWNRSILSIHHVLSRFFHLDKPFDEKVGDVVENYKEKLEEKKQSEKVLENTNEEKKE